MDVRRFHPKESMFILCATYAPPRSKPRASHFALAPSSQPQLTLTFFFDPRNSYQALFSRFLGVLVIMAPTITLVVGYMGLVFPHHLLTYLRVSSRCSSSSPYRAYAWCSRKIPQNRNSNGEKWPNLLRCAPFYISNTQTELHARLHLFST